MGNKQILLSEDDENSGLVIKEHFLKNSCSDHYLTKPFMIEELIARMNTIIRRGYNGLRIKTHTPSLGKCFFGYELRSLITKGVPNKRTTKENLLLHLLYNKCGEVLDRQTALFSIWGAYFYNNGRSMDVYISKFKKTC
jgi:DNA-binding response OmpR family regulator